MNRALISRRRFLHTSAAAGTLALLNQLAPAYGQTVPADSMQHICSRCGEGAAFCCSAAAPPPEK